MSTDKQEAIRIPIVHCGECRDAFDHVEWQALRLMELREPIGKGDGAEVRQCCGCDGPIVVPLGILADAKAGHFVATREQYEQLYPDNARPTVKPRTLGERLRGLFS